MDTEETQAYIEEKIRAIDSESTTYRQSLGIVHILGSVGPDSIPPKEALQKIMEETGIAQRVIEDILLIYYGGPSQTR